jgi:signal transduction histidine kinase
MVELHLFRIVQEAVNNIEKHAKAKSVKLQLRFQGEAAVLKIQDDGEGFDPKTLRAVKKIRHGLGLTNMRERALSLGGTYEIKSAPGRGTSIVVRVPLSAAHRDSNLKKERVGNQTALAVK